MLRAAIHRLCAGDVGTAGLWARVEACPPSAVRSCALAGRALLQSQPAEAEFYLDQAAYLASQPGDLPADFAAITHGLRAALHASGALGDLTVSEAAAGLRVRTLDHGISRWLIRLLATGRCYTQGPRSALNSLLGTPVTGSSPPDAATALELGCYYALAGEPAQAVGVLSLLTDPLTDPLADLLADPLADGQCEISREVGSRQWLAFACHLLGYWQQAEGHARAAIGAVRQSRIGTSGGPFAIAALLAAHAARWDEANHWLRLAREYACGPDDEVLADLAQATLAHARGRPSLGEPALRRLVSAGDAGRKFRSLWLPLRAEAMVEAGVQHQAVATLDELRALSDDVPYLHVVVLRLSGRLAEQRRDPQAARRCYEAILELPAECLAVPFQVGLLEHDHGRLLSRLGDLSEGTTTINQARHRLASAGALAYARRCDTDLVGAHRPASTEQGPPVLTDRELAVARLVVAGLTNTDVASRLYISVKTVEYHLAQIYAKLGISSRRQLLSRRLP